mgnify:FL=1
MSSPFLKLPVELIYRIMDHLNDQTIFWSFSHVYAHGSTSSLLPIIDIRLISACISKQNEKEHFILFFAQIILDTDRNQTYLLYIENESIKRLLLIISSYLNFSSFSLFPYRHLPLSIFH